MKKRNGIAYVPKTWNFINLLNNSVRSSGGSLKNDLGQLPPSTKYDHTASESFSPFHGA